MAELTSLPELASRLLAEGGVGVVIGWEEGPRGVRPAFVTRPEDAGRLIFDPRCVHNLAAYLSPRRNHLATLGKKAVVVKGCDAKAVAALIRETQLDRANVVIIGVHCGGVVKDPRGTADLTPVTLAPRCVSCQDRVPHLVDHLLGSPQPPPPAPAAKVNLLGELEAMSPRERWAFWEGELSRCVRCYACREVCPLCFCERCVASKTEPQWIESSPHTRGNLAWQLVRVLHMAGRCVGCGECTRACPAGIPLGLMLKKAAQTVEQRYGYRATDDPAVPAPIGAYRLDDPQEFIL